MSFLRNSVSYLVFFLNITTAINIIMVVVKMFLLYKLLEELGLLLGVFLAENRQQVLSTLWHWRLDCLIMVVIMLMVAMVIMIMLLLLLLMVMMMMK